jgi:2-polyprenyl-3-methyl-5-hydroxy-6-metoxy-1,4-benzoquinol methylase
MLKNINGRVTCPICQSNELSIITNKVRFNISADVMKCNICSLIFLNQLSFSFPQNFYEHEYHQTYLTHIEPDVLEPEKYYAKMKKTTKTWSDKFIKYLKGDEIILDVGCSTGHFITNIQNNAQKVYGHELNKKEVEFCRESLGLDVSDMRLEKRFKEGMFDYITLIFVFEHIANPVEYLVYLKRFLRKNGKIIILVPNAEDPLLSFYSIPEFMRFYFCIEHLYYYTPETIGKVFAKAGMKGPVERLQEYPIINHLNWGYRRKPSDTMAARKNAPDIPLNDESVQNEWDKFWIRVDIMYKQFLYEQNFGDRIWCEVESYCD